MEWWYSSEKRTGRKEKVTSLFSDLIVRMLIHANQEFGKSEVSKEYDKELMEKKRFGDQMLGVMEVSNQ